MTIASATNKHLYAGNGAQTVFPYTFVVWHAADLRVVRRSATGVEMPLTLDTDFTVSGVGDANGGYVTLSAPLAAGEYLLVKRVLDLVQETDLVENAATPAAVMEGAFDRLTAMVQQIAEAQDRAITMPETSTPGEIVNVEDLRQAVAEARTASTDAVAARDAAIAARDIALQAAAGLDLPDVTASNAGYYLGVLPGGTYGLLGDFTGATASNAGTAGLVPAPAAGDEGKFLTAAGAWETPASGGTSKWTALTATDYTATPASTSTLNMTTDQTANIPPGAALRYTIGGVSYYGVVTAITAGLLTVAGAPLSGDVTALDYSIFPGMVETMTLSDPGAWADSADTALVANDLLMALVWPGPPAALVRIQAWTRTTDTGASKPRINARLGATTTDFVSTANGNAGLELAASATWAATGVDIDPTKYALSQGTGIELKTDANGSNDDARDLTVVMTFVYA